jgi:hypothetical protein
VRTAPTPPCRVLDETDPDRTVPRIVEPGDLGTLLPSLFPAAAGAALFAFLDPFGTALDVDRLRDDFLRRPGRAPTEVLLHFSVSTIARMGGILNAGLARGGLTIPERKTVARADAFLGGDWWRAEFEGLRGVVPLEAADGTSWIDLDDADPFPETETSALLTATDVAMRVARRFCDNLGELTQYRTVSMPVRPEPGPARSTSTSTNATTWTAGKPRSQQTCTASSPRTAAACAWSTTSTTSTAMS